MQKATSHVMSKISRNFKTMKKKPNPVYFSERWANKTGSVRAKAEVKLKALSSWRYWTGSWTSKNNCKSLGKGKGKGKSKSKGKGKPSAKGRKKV